MQNCKESSATVSNPKAFFLSFQKVKLNRSKVVSLPVLDPPHAPHGLRVAAVFADGCIYRAKHRIGPQGIS